MGLNSAEPFATQLAKLLDPVAWSECSKPSSEMLLAREKSLADAANLMPFLNQHGVREAPDTLGETLQQVSDLLSEAADLIGGIAAPARDDIRGIGPLISEAIREVDEAREDIVCTECGAFNNDGEGFDGKCGNCADRSSDEDGEPLDLSMAVSQNDDELIDGLEYAAFADPHNEGMYRGAIFEYGELSKTTLETYEDVTGAIGAAARLYEGVEEEFVDADRVDPDPVISAWSYGTVFYDDENKFRGVWFVNEDPKATTDLLYWRPSAAREAARDLVEKA